LFIKPRFVN